MKFKQLFIALITIISFNFFNQAVSANESDTIPFRIEAIKPDNQINNNKNASYLDLFVKPSTSQTISFNITNSDDTSRQFIVELSDATTSDGLSIDYSPANNSLIKSPRISEMISTSDKTKIIEVSGKSLQKVDFTLNYPSNPIQGIVLGGVSVTTKDSQTKSTGGIGIQNKYRYAVAVQLRGTTSPASIRPNIELVDAIQDISNGYPVVKTTLKNSNPALISQVSTASELKDKNGKVLATYNTSLGQVAPISQFNLLIPLNEGALSPGDYTVSGEMKSNKTNERWTWVKSFTVNDSNYKKINEENVDKKTDFTLCFWILLFLMLASIIFFIILKKRKKRKEDDYI